MRDVAILGVGMHRFGSYYGEKSNAEMGLAAGMDTPAGLTALAVFYATGSIAPPGAPEVAPSPDLTAKLLAAALTLALELVPAADKLRYQRLCIDLAGRVAAGQLRWEQ